MSFVTTTLARMLYAVPFGVFGILHFVKAKQMVGLVPSFFPAKLFFVYLTGLALIAVCISILTGIKVKLACLLLALMLIIFVLTIHLPAVLKNMGAISNLLKDVSLAGAALFLAGISKD